MAKYNGLNATLVHNLNKKIEELRTSEEKFRTIFEGANDGILVADAKTKKFVFANPKICKLTGYSEKELLELGIENIHSTKDLPYVLDQFTKQLQGIITLAKDIPVLRKDKSVVYCDVNATPLKIKDQEVAVGFFRDITERREAEEKLQKSYFYLNAMADILCVVDLNGKIIEANNSLFKLFGLSREETIGKSIFKLFPKEESAKHKNEMQIAAKTGTVRKFETVALTKDKKRIPLNASGLALKDEKGKLIGFIAIFSDVTERKKAEETIRETKNYLDNLLSYANAPIIVWDNNKRITLFNKAFEAFTGQKQEAVLGKKIDLLFPPSQKKDTLQTIEKATKGEKLKTVEIPILCKNKEIKIALWNSANITDSNGKMVATIAQGQDITERKKAEEALKEAKAFTESALNSISDIFYSFDLSGKFLSWNKTFTRISGYSDQELSSKKPTDFFLDEDVQRVAKAVKRIYKEGTSKVDANFVLKDGRQIPCEFTGSILKDGKGNIIGFSGTGRDITDCKKAEEELKQSEEKYRTIVENAVDYIFVLDKNQKFISINKNAARLSGKSPEELIGKSIFTMFPKESATRFAKNNKEIIKTGKSKVINEKMIVKRREFYINTILSPIRGSEGNVTAVMGIVRDITKQKSTEQELDKKIKQLAQLRHIIDGLKK